MEEKLTAFKAAIAAVFTALGAFLGWQGVLVAIWGGCMLLDYLSGTIAAWATGEWSSKVAREGLRHKGGIVCNSITQGVLIRKGIRIVHFAFYNAPEIFCGTIIDAMAHSRHGLCHSLLL